MLTAAYLQMVSRSLSEGGYAGALKTLATLPDPVLEELCELAGMRFLEVKRDIEENAEIYGVKKEA